MKFINKIRKLIAMFFVFLAAIIAPPVLRDIIINGMAMYTDLLTQLTDQHISQKPVLKIVEKEDDKL